MFWLASVRLETNQPNGIFLKSVLLNLIMIMDLRWFYYHTLVFLKRSCEKYNWGNALGWN